MRARAAKPDAQNIWSQKQVLTEVYMRHIMGYIMARALEGVFAYVLSKTIHIRLRKASASHGKKLVTCDRSNLGMPQDLTRV